MDLVEVDRAGEKGLAEDERRDPSVAKATYPVERCNAACDAQLERGESRRDHRECSSLCSVTTVGEHDARNTRGDQFVEELFGARCGGAAPWVRGKSLGTRVETDRQPVARSPDAFGEERRMIDDRHRNDGARGASGECEADRFGRFHPPGDLERRGDESRDGTDRLEVHGRTGARTVEVDEVDQRRSAVDECAGDARRLGALVRPRRRRASRTSRARCRQTARSACPGTPRDRGWRRRHPAGRRRRTSTSCRSPWS